MLGIVVSPFAEASAGQNRNRKGREEPLAHAPPGRGWEHRTLREWAPLQAGHEHDTIYRDLVQSRRVGWERAHDRRNGGVGCR